MKKPIIGVLPLWDEKKESLWMLPGYMDGIISAGGIPVMLPLTDQADIIKRLSKRCNGFLFTGGQDVSPEFYGETVKFDNVGCCAKRDKMESMLLREVLAADKPVLGICRGIQFINAALGGTLYQDIPKETDSELVHHQNPPYDKPSHSVKIEKGTPLYGLLKKDSLEVNSYHHQAIKNLSPRVKAMAYAPDGIAEAIYLPDKKFVWAVQWHPEFSYLTDDDSMKIFNKFIENCEA